ncbi:PREDICTED: 15 kDa selenoprotein-like [Acropora digitifera]|uniref:15 kDa selenoprotein-like n=1 Tax=Acropora digitifera TaxID=70779 RepID=UPI00077AE7D9|nr:PREDICTED: 15 kDa selenoprotein-like [Acropora digitifera]
MKDPGSEPTLSCANVCIDGMMDLTSYFSPFLSLFLALIHFTVSELTPEQCRDLGFSVNLLCSSCDELKPFNLASEPSIEENCRKCCHADGQEEAAKRYAFGTLEVCN